MTAFYNKGPYNAGVYSRGTVWPLTGEFSINFELSADFSNPVDMIASMPITVTLAATTVGLLRPFKGGFGITMELEASIINAGTSLDGNIPISASLVANVTVAYSLESDDSFSFQPSMLGDAEFGPLWVPDGCPVEVNPWDKTEACSG